MNTINPDNTPIVVRYGDYTKLQADHAQLVALVREWADALQAYDDSEEGSLEKFHRFNDAQRALLQARKELGDEPYSANSLSTLAIRGGMGQMPRSHLLTVS